MFEEVVVSRFSKWSIIYENLLIYRVLIVFNYFNTIFIAIFYLFAVIRIVFVN